MAASKEAQFIQLDMTSCPICFETFNIPKYLPCLHCFCEGCLQTYISSAFRMNSACKGINYPVCRELVEKPVSTDVEKWADEFPSNHLLVSIIDMNKAKSESRQCNPCSRENESVGAKKWCVNCNEALCESCERHHRKLKYTSQHRVVEIEDLEQPGAKLQSADLYCSEHPDEKLKAFCNDHSTVCCMSCVMLSHRKCDNVQSIQKAAEIKRNSDGMANLEKSLAGTKKELETIVDTMKKNVSECQTSIANVRSVIEQIFNDFITHMESLRDKALKEVLAVEKDVLPNIEREIEEIKHKLSAVENDIELSRTNSEYSSSAQFLHTTTQLEEQRKILEKFVSDKTKSLQKIEITFQINEQISQVVRTISSFGKTSVHQKSIAKIDVLSATPILVQKRNSNAECTGVVLIKE